MLDLADDRLFFLDVLVEVAQARMGEGWSTGGMLGGSGFNVYVETDAIMVEVNRRLYLREPGTEPLPDFTRVAWQIRHCCITATLAQ